jgi:hypothetical protein
MARHQKKLGEILVEWGIINAKEQQKAADHAKAKNMRMGEALQDLKLCSENNVFKALATQHNMEFIDLDKSAVAPNAVTLVPDELMKKHLILPLSQENGKLKIAICDPLDLETLDILRFRLNKEIRTVLAPKSRIATSMTFSAAVPPAQSTRPSTRPLPRSTRPSTNPSIVPSTNPSTSPAWAKMPCRTPPRRRSSSWCTR